MLSKYEELFPAVRQDLIKSSLRLSDKIDSECSPNVNDDQHSLTICVFDLMLYIPVNNCSVMSECFLD